MNTFDSLELLLERRTSVIWRRTTLGMCFSLPSISLANDIAVLESILRCFKAWAFVLRLVDLFTCSKDPI